MTMSQMTLPISVQASGPASAGWLVFRRHPEVRLSVVVKASFALVEATDRTAEPPPMHAISPQDLFADDRNHMLVPTGSVEYAGDFAPYLGRTDVLLTGLVHPPAASARLLVGRHGTTLLDKTLFVTQPTRSPLNPIALLYEQAYGGPTHPENPVGRLEPMLWNGQSVTRAVGFGAISRHWPARARALERARYQPRPGAFLDLPLDFSWDALQAAPPDQQLSHLRGDEWLRIDGVAHRDARLTGRLPSLSARAVEGGRPAEDLSFVIDQLAIDASARRCHVRLRAIAPWSGAPRELQVEVLSSGAPLEIASSAQTSAATAMPSPAALAGTAAPALPFAKSRGVSAGQRDAVAADTRPRVAVAFPGAGSPMLGSAMPASVGQSTTAPANLSVIGDLATLLRALGPPRDAHGR